jgi:hypothetical protein
MLRKRQRIWISVFMIILSICGQPTTCKAKQSTHSPTSEEKASSSKDELIPRKISIGHRSLASLIALGSGTIISGGGHWWVGSSSSASRLLWWKLGGLAGVTIGGFALAQSGASNIVTPWATPLLIFSGATTIMPSLLDLIGIWQQPQASISLPKLDQAPLLKGKAQTMLSVQSGIRQTVLQPYHLFNAIDWTQQLGRSAYQLSGSWSQLQSRFQIHTEHYFTQGIGWSLWGRAGLSTHQQPQSEVSLYQGEAMLRFALRFGQLIGPSLKSMSGHLSAGWSGGALFYRTGPADQLTGILGGFGLTHHSLQDRLRVGVTYNHRHDDWVGGAIIPGLGSGILGFLQAETSIQVSQRLWISAQANWGAAHLYTLGLNWALNPVQRTGE